MLSPTRSAACTPTHFTSQCKNNYFITTTSQQCEQRRRRNVKRFRGGLAFKAHRHLYHSTRGSRVIKKKKSPTPPNQLWPKSNHGSHGVHLKDPWYNPKPLKESSQKWLQARIWVMLCAIGSDAYRATPPNQRPSGITAPPNQTRECCGRSDGKPPRHPCEDSYSYPWSPFPPRRVRPGPGPHSPTPPESEPRGTAVDC